MSEEDKRWHARRYLGIHRVIVLCAWLIAMQDLKHWFAPAALTVLLLLHIITDFLTAEDEPSDEAQPKPEKP